MPLGPVGQPPGQGPSKTVIIRSGAGQNPPAGCHQELRQAGQALGEALVNLEDRDLQDDPHHQGRGQVGVAGGNLAPVHAPGQDLPQHLHRVGHVLGHFLQLPVLGQEQVAEQVRNQNH